MTGSAIELDITHTSIKWRGSLFLDVGYAIPRFILFRTKEEKLSRYQYDLTIIVLILWHTV